MSDFPAWFYGPNGEAEIFEAAEQVPAGWADAPGKVKTVDAPEETGDSAPKPEGSLPEAKRRGRPPKVAVTEDEF